MVIQKNKKNQFGPIKMAMLFKLKKKKNSYVVAQRIRFWMFTLKINGNKLSGLMSGDIFVSVTFVIFGLYSKLYKLSGKK